MTGATRRGSAASSPGNDEASIACCSGFPTGAPGAMEDGKPRPRIRLGLHRSAPATSLTPTSINPYAAFDSTTAASCRSDDAVGRAPLAPAPALYLGL